MKKSLPEPVPLMTIHELAALMLAKFDEQSQKIVSLEQRMNEGFTEQDKKIEQRFAAQDKRIEQGFAEQDKKIEQRFFAQDKEIEQRFADQDKKWEMRLDQRFAAQDKKMEERFFAQEKKWDVKFESLAMMVARGFEEQHKNLEEFKQETAKKFEAVEGNLVAVRQDIRTMGDRFVSFHVFDQWAHRVIALETTQSKKK